MTDAGCGGVFYAEIIYDESERDAIGLMGLQSRHKSCWLITMSCKSFY